MRPPRNVNVFDINIFSLVRIIIIIIIIQASSNASLIA